MDRAATRLSASALRICTLLASGGALTACPCTPLARPTPDAGSQCPAIIDAGSSPRPVLVPIAGGQSVGSWLSVADGGQLFVSYGDVKVVTPSGQVSVLIPGLRESPSVSPDGGWLYAAWGTAIAQDGSLFIADNGGNCIRRFDPANGLRTVAGLCAPTDPLVRGEFADGPGPVARFAYPTGVAADQNGNVIVADTNNNRIRLIDLSGNVTTLAGTGDDGDVDGPLAISTFNGPIAVAVGPDGRIYIADQFKIRVIDRNADPPLGRVSTLAGGIAPGFADGSGPDGRAAFNQPEGLAIDDVGNVYVADRGNLRVRKIDPAGNVTTVVGDGSDCYQPGSLPPNGPANVANPTGVAIDAAGNLYIAGGMPLSVIRF